MLLHRPWAPLVALVIVQLSFGSLAAAGKYAIEHGIPPLAIAALRVSIAATILAAVAVARKTQRVPGRDIARLAGLALLGVVFNQILFLEGLERTTAVNASILIVLIPVFTLLIAVLLGRETFDGRRLFAVGLALAGTLALLRAERFDLANDLILGNVLVVLNCLSYSWYLVLARPVLQRHSSSTVVAWTFLLAAVPMAPLGVPDILAAAPRFTPPVIGALLWIILVSTVFAYGLNNYALRRLHASTVGGFVFLQPLFGIGVALALLPGESLEPRAVVAGLAILAGVVLLSRTKPVSRVATRPGVNP